MNWPLNVDNFSFLDRLKLCSFLLNRNNRWTQGSQVELFENEMAKFIGSKYAVFCSSGSTANTLLAMELKMSVPAEKKIVVFPSTTWITSVSPFLREGFEPKFIDVDLNDLCLNYSKLENFLEKNAEKVACVFPTSLLGFTPDMGQLIKICDTYSVRLMMDNCENTFGKYAGKNISSFVTSTTSTYFGHHLQSVEGGFVFTNSQDEYERFLMLRNHGMTRSLKNPHPYRNRNVDARFDFRFLGNNFRNSDINAFIGRMDLAKAQSHIKKRCDLYEIFNHTLFRSKFILPTYFPAVLGLSKFHVPFCLPIISLDESIKEKAIIYCENAGIETRPIISGNLLRQSCLKHYDEYINFPQSEFLHKNGFYIGLHVKLKKEDVFKLASDLNNL